MFLKIPLYQGIFFTDTRPNRHLINMHGPTLCSLTSNNLETDESTQK